MKIVFLCRLFYPHIGGVEKHVFEISKRLINKGHDVSVITEALDNTPMFEEVHGVAIYRIHAGDEGKVKKFRIWKEMRRLKEIIEDADVVHCHDVFFWYLPFRFLFPQKPVYTTFHGYENYPITKNAIQVRRLAEKLSSGNICIGDFIPKWYGTKATFVSYGATVIPKQETSVKSNKLSAVFIGRLDEQTGALTYTKTAELLQKKYPKFVTTFIGDGKYRKQIEKKFTSLGFQNNPEKYFSKYHFAFVSRYLSILEAFAAKRLVFATYDNPVKEDYLRLAPFAKWIIIEKDPNNLAEKVIYYLEHSAEEDKRIEEAYRWVTKQSWDNMVNLYLKLWNKSM